MTIDWQRIGRSEAFVMNVRADPPTFSDDQIAAAVETANQLPANGDDPNKVASLWDLPPNMPTVGDVDFRDVQVGAHDLTNLWASNDTLKRDSLIWHIQNPGQRRNPGPFTANPIILTRKNKDVIVDGQHCLAALKLLGQTSWPCYLVPTK